MKRRTYSIIGAIALAWSGAAAAADAAKEDATPLDPARVQAGGSGASGESGISKTESAGAVKEGEEVRARRETPSHEDQHAKDDSDGNASEQREEEPGAMQGEGGISSDSRNP